MLAKHTPKKTTTKNRGHGLSWRSPANAFYSFIVLSSAELEIRPHFTWKQWLTHFVWLPNSSADSILSASQFPLTNMLAFGYCDSNRVVMVKVKQQWRRSGSQLCLSLHEDGIVLTSWFSSCWPLSCVTSKLRDMYVLIPTGMQTVSPSCLLMHGSMHAGLLLWHRAQSQNSFTVHVLIYASLHPCFGFTGKSYTVFPE